MTLMITAFSMMTLNIKSLYVTQHNNALHYAECHNAECRVLLIVILSVTMLNVVMMSVMAPTFQQSVQLI
jgi:hypothetical protein